MNLRMYIAGFIQRFSKIVEEIKCGTPSENNYTVGKKIQLYRKIFKIFKDYASVQIDEVDTVLDILLSHHFAVGKEEELEPC